ncbi:unnamed protein product, partial [Amoebophrya sp. A120]|eukprot:GSA120T00002893001.1
MSLGTPHLMSPTGLYSQVELSSTQGRLTRQRVSVQPLPSRISKHRAPAGLIVPDIDPDEPHPQPGVIHFTQELLVSDFDKLLQDFDEALAQYIAEHRREVPESGKTKKLDLVLEYTNFVRVLIEEFLRYRPPPVFERVFAGDCHRLAHIVALLDNVAFASRRSVLTDYRWKQCRATVELVCEIVRKMQCGEQLEKAIFAENKFVRGVLLRYTINEHCAGRNVAFMAPDQNMLRSVKGSQHWEDDLKGMPKASTQLHEQTRIGLKDMREMLRRMLDENRTAAPLDARDIRPFPALPAPQQLITDPRFWVSQALDAPQLPTRPGCFEWWHPEITFPKPQFTMAHVLGLYVSEEEKTRRAERARMKGKPKHWKLPGERAPRQGTDDMGSEAEYEGFRGRYVRRRGDDAMELPEDPKEWNKRKKKKLGPFRRIPMFESNRKLRYEGKADVHYTDYNHIGWSNDLEAPSDVEQIDAQDHGGKITAYIRGQHLSISDFHATTSNLMKARLEACKNMRQLDQIPPPSQAATPGDWVYYQIKRLQLNDETLTRLVLDGISLPLASQASILPDMIAALHRNTSLELLSLGGCELPTLFGRAFGNVLKDNKCLREVNLEANQFDHIACMAIAEGLRTNEHIERLSLSENPGAVGRYKAVETAFMNALVENRSLSHLGLTVTDPTMRRKIDDALEHNSHRLRHPLSDPDKSSSDDSDKPKKKYDREMAKHPAWTAGRKQGSTTDRKTSSKKSDAYANGKNPAWAANKKKLLEYSQSRSRGSSQQQSSQQQSSQQQSSRQQSSDISDSDESEDSRRDKS